MKQKRKHYRPVFKASVALEAIRGKHTIKELAARFAVHPVQISQWKRLLEQDAEEVFIHRSVQKLALRGRLLQDIAQSLRATQCSESWMLSVVHGQMSARKLASEVAPGLRRGEAKRLYSCVTKGALPHRTRALALLSYKKGIKKSIIAKFLRVGPHYVGGIARHYSDDGIAWFSKHRRKGLWKNELKGYKEAVFEILHSPPSAHGINRTAWIRRDIKRVMAEKGVPLGINGIDAIIRNAGYRFLKAKVVLTSNDPDYEQKVQTIIKILSGLKPDEKFFSVDEYGPFAVKIQGGRSLMKPERIRTVPQHQQSKGSLILTAALELSENQVAHFYSGKKNTDEMLKLLEILVLKYATEARIYFSWDAASWHASKKFIQRVEEINSAQYRATHKIPLVKLAPLPSRAQFLNVIESVFSGMAKAIIHNSDYQSVEGCKAAIDRYFDERNQHFKTHPSRAGGKIWGKELVAARFHAANNCKDPKYGWPNRAA